MQDNLNDWWLTYLLWSCPQMNVTGPHWLVINIGSGNGLVPNTPSHYLRQCWPTSLSPYGIIKPQYFVTLTSQLFCDMIDWSNIIWPQQIVLTVNRNGIWNVNIINPLCWVVLTKKKKCFCIFYRFSNIKVFLVLPYGRHIPVYPTYTQYRGYWWPGNTRSQGISSHGIDLVMK